MKDSSRTLSKAEREVGAAVETAVATFLTRARGAVLGTNLSADASPSQLPPDLDRWPSASVWSELVEQFVQPAIGVAFDSAFDVAARTDLLEQHRYRQTYMDEVNDRLSQSLWPSEAFEQVRGDLAEGLDAGESIPQLRDRVGAALGVDRHSHQAERIARTEAHTATEGGSWSAEMAWQEATGEQLYHLWDASLDSRTRPEHANAHNQIRPISDPFAVGGYPLMFPGDPAGPAHLTVNCRCTRLTGAEDELRNLAGLSPNTPPVETPQERVERILSEAVDGDDALARVMPATDLHNTQQDAFVRYTGSAYASMNKAARQRASAHAPQAIINREGRNPTTSEIEEWERLTGQAPTADDLAGTGAYSQWEIDSGTPGRDSDTFAEMNKGFATEPIREPVKLYRGVEDISRLMGRNDDLIGMEFGDAAVVSSSADLDVAKGFAMGGPILEVLTDAGTPAVNVTPISEYENEREVIFPQGTRFRVVSDDRRDDGQRYVQVEPVGAPGWRPTPRQKTTTAAAESPALTSPDGTGSFTEPTTWSSSPTTPSAPASTMTGAGTTEPSSPGGPMTETAVEITQPTPQAPARLFWRAAMVPLDSRADYRVITSPKDGVVLTTDLMWLKWQEKDAPGHDDAVTVGRIDRVWVQDGWLWGEGEWDLADRTGNTAEIVRKVQERFAGTISVDLRDGYSEEIVVDAEGNIVDFDTLIDTEDIDDLVAAFDRGEYKFLERVHEWRLEGCTLVQSPAYYTSRLWVLEEDALTAAITGNQDLPLADREAEWDGPEALRALQDAQALAEGCFWRDPDAETDSNVQGDYKLPFATVIDGTITAVPAGIFAVAGVLQGGMGGVDIPEADADRIRTRVEAWYERMADEFDDPDLIAPWLNDEEQEENVTADATPTRQEIAVLTAAAGVATETSTWAEQVAATIPLEPPAEWFANPDLSGPTKVRVLDNGRVYGHLATWDTTHVGMPGQAITPPRSATNYAHFQRNRIRCADGTTVWAGTLVMGTGHADTRVSSSSAMAHYDDTGYAVADIVCGEDQVGIWFSGALKPGASPLQILTLDRYSLSGDWRGGELVGACVVNVPGFPIAENELSLVAAATGGTGTLPTARLQARRDGSEVVALVASGVLAPARPSSQKGSGPTMADLHQRLDALPSQVYSATLRAQREEKEFAALFAQTQADEMAALAAQMKVL